MSRDSEKKDIIETPVGYMRLLAYNSFDLVGPWSEIKLDIVRLYAQAYSRILTATSNPHLYHVYVDGFAGSGLNINHDGDLIHGTAVNALEIKPPFEEYFFVDLDNTKVETLRAVVEGRTHVHVLGGDVNHILPQHVLPQIRYEDYRRALCVLDPYGLDLDWAVVEALGRAKSVDLFLNFPLMGMNREVLWSNPDQVTDAQRAVMTRFWGDETWQSVVYTSVGNLFGWPRKEPAWVIAQAYQQRLRRAAGFRYVVNPLPIRNTVGGLMYYLFFASQKLLAGDIIQDIFRRHGQGAHYHGGTIFNRVD